MKMKTGGRFIKNEEYMPPSCCIARMTGTGLCFAFPQERSKLYPLRFSAGKCIARLSQLYIAKAHIGKGF